MRMSPDDPLLSAYHDEMLDARGMRQVRRALSERPEVREQYTALRRTVDRLHRLPDPEPPPQFWPETYRRLREFAGSGECRRPVCRAVRGITMALLMLVLLGGAVALARALGGLGPEPRPVVRHADGAMLR